MAKIEITATHLKVLLTPSEKTWSLHGDFNLPAALVRGAEVAPSNIWKSLGFRLPGAAIPGVLIYGSYWQSAKNGGWTFALWRPKTPILSITLATSKNNKYRRLLIATPDAGPWADAINEAITAC